MFGSTRIAQPAHDAPSIGFDDDELVAQARHDRQVFGLLYDRYAEAVYRYCYRRLGSHESAEDATSLTFTKALASLLHYREGSFRGWLFAIAHHVTTDQLRQRRPAVSLEAAGDVWTAGPSPEDLALGAESHRSVHDLLRLLPEEQQRVVELRMAGLTAPEISHVLGRSLSAVKSTQFRAYARLRQFLAVEGESRDDD